MRKLWTRAVLMVAIAGPLFPVLSVAAASPAGADEPGIEQAFVAAINAQRAAHHVAPLRVDSRLVSLSRWWSQQMADAGGISHNPRLAAMLPPKVWTLGGENVGVGPRFETLEAAFEGSPEHFNNMIEPKFTAIGVGVVPKGDVLYVTEDYMAETVTRAPSHALEGVKPVAPAAPAPAVAAVAANPVGTGFWAASPAGVTDASRAAALGSLAGAHFNAPVVSMAPTPTGAGYWMLAADSGLFAFGDAPYRGSTTDVRLNRPVVSMASSWSGDGYWLAAADGGVFAFGDAGFLGSMGGRPLNQPIVGLAATTTGDGYWLVARDGGVFAFGDAVFAGSTGGVGLNQPIVAMAAAPHGGYWLLAADGGVFAFGAPFWGSAAGQSGKRFAGMAAAADGQGYWLVADDGSAFPFGDTAGPNAQRRTACKCAF